MASHGIFNGRGGCHALIVQTSIWAAQDERAQWIGLVSRLTLPNLHLLCAVLLGRDLGDGNRQYAIFEMCVDCIAFGVRGKAERPAERSVLPFGKVPRLTVLLARSLLLTAQYHCAIFNRQMDIVFRNTGQFDGDPVAKQN